MEYAIIKDSGVQFKVQVGDRIDVDNTAGEKASAKTFGDVLLVNREGAVTIGQPTVNGAAVKATLLEHFKGPKVISYKVYEMNSKATRKGFRAKKTAFVIEKICATAEESAAWDAAHAQK
ncbi:MAG: 50S ribosomal protein L21 [Planctomycetota bacterium]